MSDSLSGVDVLIYELNMKILFFVVFACCVYAYDLYRMRVFRARVFLSPIPLQRFWHTPSYHATYSAAPAKTQSNPA